MGETRKHGIKERKMKKICMVLLIAITVGIAAIPANAAQAIDFNIRFFDKRIYYAPNDPIYVQITITNNSPLSYRFKLADDRAFSMDFNIWTVTNRKLDSADVLTRKRTQSQQVFFREIAVEPGESFSFVEDLRDFVNIRQHGAFVVQATVYPELYRTALVNQRLINSTVTDTVAMSQTVSVLQNVVQTLESNRLNLNIRPADIYGPDGAPVEMDSATGAVLVRQEIPPDQVVDYLITARQKSQWEKFFLYIDLEAMLMARDPVRRRQWLNEGEVGRRQMLKEFREELQKSTVDGTISVIPISYTIERTTYNQTSGTVIVREKFRGGENFTEIKQYTYDLVKKNNIWSVVNYSVTNIGTE
jgi:hypothetical protein